VITASFGAYVGSRMQNSMDIAFTNAWNHGIFVDVAAGNDGRPADFFSPAHANKIIAVGSFGQTNRISSWSNYGRYVAAMAPGENIVSTDGTLAQHF
jgi:subtilisin family serine protease